MHLTRFTLLMTRPEMASTAFVDALPQDIRARCDVIMSPLMQIEPVPDPVVPDFDAALFTSANGVDHAPDGQNRPAYCVGAATTQRAKDAGWTAQQAGHDAETLVQSLVSQMPKGRLVHFSGAHTRGNIAERLTAAGITTVRVVVYDQPLLPLSRTARAALAGDGPVVVPLFSPRSALHFCDQVSAEPAIHVAAISDMAAQPCRSNSEWRIVVADTPDLSGMQDALQKLVGTALSG